MKMKHRNIYFAFFLTAFGCLFGLALPISAQPSKGFRPVALHVAPGNLAVLEYQGVPLSKGTADIELPIGLCPERVYWSMTSVDDTKSGVQEQPGLSKPSAGATDSAIGVVQTVLLQMVRDSVRKQRLAGDFSALISINIGRTVSVETFDGSENIGYSGTILGMDQKGEVLTLSAGQEIHNIPVRQIMYWSSGSDWEQAREWSEPSRYRLHVMAPNGWDGSPIRVWVETKNVDCAYSYRLKTGGKARIALDFRLQTSFTFDELEVVGHSGQPLASIGGLNSPLFRLVAPDGSGTGVLSTTALEEGVSLMLMEEWNFGAVSPADSHFQQSPVVRSYLSIKGGSDAPGFQLIPLYMEHENAPPLLIAAQEVSLPGFDLMIRLDKPVLNGSDTGKIRRGRWLTEDQKPVGPEGWWVDGQIEAGYSGSIPVEWTIRRSFLPAELGNSNLKVLISDPKDLNVEAHEFRRTIQIPTGKRSALSYSYFLSPLQKVKK